LLRDNVVYENWEGTHNVLCAQVLRDCARLGVHDGFFEVLAERLGEGAVAAHRQELTAILAEEPDIAALRFRTLAKRLAVQVMLAAMSPVETLRDHATLVARHLEPLKVDADYMALIDRLQR